MPYTRFICPDGGEITIEDCLKKCRLQGKINPVTGDYYVPCGRCLSAPTLRKLSKQREWTGKPSTTQCLRGTREAFLTITKDYAVDPKSMMFALLGTQTHANLEDGMGESDIGEQRLDDGISTGAFDFYSPENGGTLFDYKTYSSFVVAKYLGIKSKKVQVGWFKNGKPRYKTMYTKGNAKLDFDLAVQLNDYRMKIESQLKLPVSHLVCEMIVRDGGTYIANSRGVTERSYLIEVGKISDHWMKLYMERKASDLIKAVELNKMPPPCRGHECWHGRKCKDFCPVNKYCDAYLRGENNNG